MLREWLTTRENFHGHQDMANGKPRMFGCQPQNYSCNILWLPPSSDRQPLGYHVHTDNRGGQALSLFPPGPAPLLPHRDVVSEESDGRPAGPHDRAVLAAPPRGGPGPGAFRRGMPSWVPRAES